MKLLSFSALLAILFLSSCSKKSTPAPATNPNVGTISINGGTYATIIIGNQTWTVLNYVGSGGVSTTDATYGNYYTLAQATSITLPAGWRIPTRADFNTLLSNYTSTKNSNGDYVGDRSTALALADTSTGATNTSGLGLKLGGYYDPIAKTVTDKFDDGVYLTSTTGTQGGNQVNYFFGITDDNVSIGQSNLAYFASIDYFTNLFGYSLRFVKDN